jgi:HSP20 family protein
MANLIRWTGDPFTGITSLHNQLDEMFNSLFERPPAAMHGVMPAMDVYTDNNKELVTEIQAPGFSRDEIDINVNEGVLEIKGMHHEKDEQKDKKRSYMVRESSASFFRRVALPKNADPKNVKAEFDNGVLRVMVPDGAFKTINNT